jgi:Tol biopolymer transport system component
VGYDNQPTFSVDGKSILYVVIDSTKQADIYQYNIGKKISLLI